MTTTWITCDIYKLEVVNTTVSTYSKNTAMDVGAFARPSSYTKEILCDPDLTGIPDGSTITSAAIEYRVTSNSMFGVVNYNMSAWNNDKNSWTDTPSTEPDYNTPFGTIMSWADLIEEDSKTWNNSTSIGTYEMDASSTLDDLVQDWIDGVENQWGFVVAMDSQYYNAYVTIDQIRLKVVYESVEATVVPQIMNHYKQRRL